MEAIWNEKQVRLWSNKGKTGTGIPTDTAVISEIELQVGAEFELFASVSMDLTNRIHLYIAVQRGGFLLRRYAGEPRTGESEDEKSKKLYEKLKSIDHSDTLDPEKFQTMETSTYDDNSSFTSQSAQRNVFGLGNRYHRDDGFYDDGDDF